MSRYASLVMIGFNRPEIQRKTLERVAKAEDSDKRDIYVFIDGPRKGRDDDVANAQKVFEVFKEFRELKLPRMTIRKREVNLGCRGNIIASITEVINKTDRVIVVEDDILVSETFFTYHDSALDMYEGDKRIWCINAYVHDRMKLPWSYSKDVFLTRRFMCFGWSTWKDRWNDVDFDLKCWPEFSADPSNLKFMNDCSTMLLPAVKMQLENPNTWDVQCSFHIARKKMYSINPRYSLTKNNGSGAGVHSLKFDYVTAKHKYYNFIPKLELEIKPDDKILEISKYMAIGRPSSINIALRKLVGLSTMTTEARPSVLERIKFRLRRFFAKTPIVPWCMEPIELRPKNEA